MIRPELLGLLLEIKSQPGDTTLRLILADWLDDHGDESDRARAELLRTRARGEPEPRHLIVSHLRAWLGPLLPWCSVTRVQGGFLSVTLHDGHLASSSLQALADSEHWAWVNEVVVTPGNNPRRLANNPLLRGLNSFSCVRARDGHHLLAELANASWMETVHRLDLSGTEIPPAEFRRLTDSPHLRSLTELILVDVQIPHTLFTALAGLGVRVLKLARCHINDTDLSVLTHLAGWRALEEWDLSDNDIGDRGASALAHSNSLPRLKLLKLYGNPISQLGRIQLRERFGQAVLIAGV